MTVASYDLPAKVRNELRRLAAINILHYIYSHPPMKKISMETLMFQCYHGDATKGIISHIDMLLRGEGPYSALYLRETAEQQSSSSSSSCLVLKPDFHRSCKTFIAGKNINQHVMEHSSFKKSSPLVTGRCLLEQANNGLANIKKAYSIALTLLDEKGYPKQSRNTKDDVLASVLDEMYILLKGKASLEDEEEEDEGSNETPENSTRPESWLFYGYTAFVLFGPLAPNDYRIDLLNSRDSTDKKTSGRAVSQKQEAAKTARKKSIHFRDSLAMTNLRIQQRAQVLNQIEVQIIQLKIEGDAIERKIIRYEKRGESAKVAELESMVDNILEQMRALNKSFAEQVPSQPLDVLDQSSKRLCGSIPSTINVDDDSSSVLPYPDVQMS